MISDEWQFVDINQKGRDMTVTSLAKKTAIYLVLSDLRKPTREEWQNAVKIVATRESVKLDARDLGETVMLCQYQFPNGIDDAFILKNVYPNVEELSRKHYGLPDEPKVEVVEVKDVQPRREGRSKRPQRSHR